MSTEGTGVSYKYDPNGMRVRKVVEQSWETTNYTYHGKLLTHMTVDYTDFDKVAYQDKLHFFYDAQSRPVKVSYNGTMYTYVLNGQGDVAGRLDNSGALVVKCQYNAWDALPSLTGILADTLGKRNPLRYHGHIYDEETELYYAPKWGIRTFLNEKNGLVHVQVNGETITCTAKHSFYVRGKGWVDAKELKVRGRLELQNGENAFIEAIRHEKLETPIQVSTLRSRISTLTIFGR